MRYLDLIAENSDLQDAVLDLLTVLAGEGINSIPTSTCKRIGKAGY